MRFVFPILLICLLVCCEKQKEGQSYQLSVNATPEYGGEVIPSKPGIYKMGDVVLIKAIPNMGWEFIKWEGNITSNHNPLQVTIMQDYIITAKFEQKEFDVEVEIVGEGIVKEEIVESSQKQYPIYSKVEFTAVPDSGWYFFNWEGDYNGSNNPITLVIDTSIFLISTFKPITITVSSEIFGTGNYYVYGYSFELAEKVKTSNSYDIIPDIIPTLELLPSGEVLGAIFTTHNSNSNGFYLNGEFKSLSEANKFYDDYIEAEIGTIQKTTDRLVPFQIYTFITYKGNYVKFMIQDVRIVTNDQLTDYVEVDIKYDINKYGSPKFH